MTRKPRRVLGFVPIVLLGLVATPTQAGPPTAAGIPPARPADYAVVFWYARSDPMNSMRHQIYDVRKGQYTPAVVQWVETLPAKYPAYAAYVKEVRLDPESPASEKKQLATVILQEYGEKGGPYGGYGLRDAGGLYGGANLHSLIRPGADFSRPVPDVRIGAGTYLRGYGFVASPGANRIPGYLLSTSPGTSAPMPFPYPYVRPHP
jgi:hypothetical protein